MPAGGGGAFFPTVFTTLSIFLNNVTVTKATLTASYTGEINFYLSANGGTNWESVTSGTEHTFTNTGNDLRFKAVGTSGAVLTKYKVSYA